MSETEASWHVHLAGLRAAEKARKQGGDPGAIEALASATAGPVTVAGFELHPASQGTIWALRKAATEFTEWADAIGMPVSSDPEKPGTREMLELGITTLIFCDSLTCWHELEAGNLGSLIVRAEAMIFGLDILQLKQLQAHFEKQMVRVAELAGEEVAAPGKSPAEATQAGA